jgi:tetratricopeptide (TPR) repeat protein
MSQEKEAQPTAKTPMEEIVGINQAIAEHVHKGSLVPEEIAKHLLTKCNSSHLHLGQTLVKEGHLKMSQLVKIMQTIGAQSKAGVSTAVASLPRQEKSGLVGSTFGNYEIVKELGRGGMGVVYQARQINTGQTMALKLLLSGPGADVVQVQRFLRESKTTASLEHPNIIRIYDIGEEAGYHYFTMQFVDGGTFEHVLERPDVALEQKLDIFSKICYALQHAHAHKIIHRDLKPSNILMDKNGVPFLSDFGLAKSLDSDSRLTQTGSVLGTPFYMSPEQVKGDRRKIDSRSDVYSLGIMLYQIITGKVPFVAEVLPELYRKIAEEEAAFPDIALPPALKAICSKAIEKKPDLRYTSAAELGDDVNRFVAGKKTLAQKFVAKRAWGNAIRRYRRQLIAAVWVAGVSMLAAMAMLMFHQQKNKEAAARAAYAAQIQAITEELQGCYDEGTRKLGDNPEEACLYFEHGLQIVSREQAKGDKSLLARSKAEEMAARLHVAAVDAYFRAGHYRQSYEMGDRLLHRDSLAERERIMWQTACSAYAGELFREAEEYFGKLSPMYETKARQQSLSLEEEEYYIGSIYHLGLINFQREQWPQAQQHFKQALTLHASNNKPYSFVPLLQLHYCATLVVDIEQKLGPQTAQEIQAYLQPQQEALSPQFYREVEARYWLLLAQSGEGEEAKRWARQTVAVIAECLAQGAEKAEFYYIRGRANHILGSYPQAKSDFVTASEFEDSSSKFNYMSAQLELFNDYLEPNGFQNYYMEFLRDVEKNIRVRPNLFAQEYAKLRRYCLASQFGMSKRIEFSQTRLQELCQLLDSSSQIRQVAEVTLSAMSPTAQVVRALQNKIEEAPSDNKRQLLRELCHKVEETERKRLMQRLLVELSQLQPYGRIWKLRQFCNAETIEFLQSVFADRQQSLFLRFLAGRVLVNIPLLETRKSLWQKYAKGTDDIVTTVLALRLLQEISFITVLEEIEPVRTLVNIMEKGQIEQLGWGGEGGGLACSRDEEREFFQTLLAETLPADLENLVPVWKWLLTSKSARVKSIAAMRFPLPPHKDLLPFLVAAIQEGIAQPHLDLRLWNVSLLANYLNTAEPAVRKNWQKLFDQYFFDEKLYRQFCEMTKSTLPQVQKTMLNFWRGTANVLFQEKYAERRQTVVDMLRQFWKNADSIIRCHAVMTSAELFDVEVLKAAFARQEFTFLEKWSICIGAMLCQEHSKVAKQDKQITKLMFSALKNPRESPHLRGGLLFMLTRYSQNNAETAMEKAVIEYTLVDGLKSPSTVHRLWAITSISNFTHVSDNLVALLQKMKNEHPNHNIRAACHGVLLDLAVRGGSSAKLDTLHAEVKQQKGKEREDYFWSALWGYTFAVEEVMNPNYDEGCRIGWEPEATWEFKCKDLCRKCIAKPSLRKEFILRLSKSLDLLSEFTNEGLFLHYTYMLAVLYQMEGDYAKALQTLENGIAKLGERDYHLTDLWGQLMLEQKRHVEVRQRMEKIMASLGKAPAWDLDKIAYRARYEAQVRRALLQAYMVDYKKSGDAKEKERLHASIYAHLYDQALLCPLQPISWIMVSDYYLHLADGDKVLLVSQRVLPRMPKNSLAFLWLARGYAAAGEWQQSLDFLQKAAEERTMVFPLPLGDYPEFRCAPASLKEKFEQHVR